MTFTGQANTLFESRIKFAACSVMSLKNHKEKEYVIACLAWNLFAGQAFPIPDPELDWDELYAFVDRQRLSGHLYMFGRSQRAGWPPDFEHKLRLDYYQYSLYGQQCSIYVRSFLRELTNRGIKVVVLKGWAHIQTIYKKDHGQRLCNDIDVLIHPSDVGFVEEILNQNGYTAEKESWPGYNRRYHNGARYFVPKMDAGFADTFSIGLHWGLIHFPSYDPKKIDIDEVFASVRQLQVMGLDVFQLAPEDEVVYLCGHAGLHHRFEDALFRYYEIAFLLSHAASDFDWQKVIERTMQWRHVLLVRNILNHINDLWSGMVDDDVLGRLGKLKAGLGEYFVDLWIRKTRGNLIYDHLLVWLTFPRFWERPLIMLQDIFPSAEYMFDRYGNPPFGFLPALYLIRFLRSIGVSPRHSQKKDNGT